MARILSSDAGLRLNGPVQFADKVKLITVPVPSSVHVGTAQEALMPSALIKQRERTDIIGI